MSVGTQILLLGVVLTAVQQTVAWFKRVHDGSGYRKNCRMCRRAWRGYGDLPLHLRLWHGDHVDYCHAVAAGTVPDFHWDPDDAPAQAQPMPGDVWTHAGYRWPWPACMLQELRNRWMIAHGRHYHNPGWHPTPASLPQLLTGLEPGTMAAWIMEVTHGTDTAANDRSDQPA